LPLSSFTAIELPFARQRRVAISAVVTGRDETGETWQLAVSSAHLDATTNWGGLRLFAAGLRAKQARALARALEHETRPLVLGSDLNTWWGGRNEGAFQTLERSLFRIQTEPHMETELHVETEPRTFRSGGQKLDYMFLRLPSGVSANVQVLDDRLGSDHAAVVATLSPSHPFTLSPS
jgi:endonuclease/exonuclease/phosphatase family metal-dependent hydrolase